MYQIGPDGHVLHHAHDNSTHQSTSRLIDRLRQNIFIPGLRKIGEAYVRNCVVCASCQPSRSPPLGELQPIDTPSDPFAAQTLDFITVLSMSRNGYDALRIITNKFTKWITLVSGKTTWGARDWAINYYDYVYSKHDSSM
jgi:hypothetical protein